MKTEELALDVIRMNRSIVRCLHYLTAEIPEGRRGDYLVLLNDVQAKYAKLADSIGAVAQSAQSQKDIDVTPFQ